MLNEQIKQKLLPIGILILTILVMAWIRVYLDGHLARQKADELAAMGNSDQAVGFYDRALHMYWPGSPDTARAVRVLSTMAQRREEEGDLPGALHVWRVLRSGLYASRGLYQPYRPVIEVTEQHIANLVAKQLDDPQSRDRQLALLQKNFDPNRGWSMLALLGFALWVASALAFIWKALTPEGKLLRQPAIRWSATFAAGYFLWLIGLYLA